MSVTIAAGQTPLLVSDFITRITTSSSSYLKAGTDFYTAFKIAFPLYAKNFGGEYYKLSKAAGDPTALPSATSSNANGKIFEIPMPTDALDLGIEDMVFENATGILSEILVVNNENESAWDITSATTAYWRHAGRKVRCYVPNAYTSSTPKYSTPYKRYPIIPTTSSDTIDGPAEDVSNLFNAWKNSVILL